MPRAGRVSFSVADAEEDVVVWGAPSPGVPLGSLGLASAAPQARKIRGYAAKGKVYDDNWNYGIAAKQIGNFESSFTNDSLAT